MGLGTNLVCDHRVISHPFLKEGSQVVCMFKTGLDEGIVNTEHWKMGTG